MNGPKRGPSTPHDRLADNFVDDLFSATDEEIIAEAREDFGSVNAIVFATRKVFEKALALKTKERLFAAQAGVKSDRDRTAGIVSIGPAQAKQRLAKALATNPQLRNWTMAARHGKSALTSGEDAEGVLQDLEELGLLDNDGDRRD